MSSESKPKTSRKSATKIHAKRPAKPSGKTPLATVVARHGSRVVTRAGKGFSLGELGAASLSPSLAVSWGLRIDARRRTILEGNVGPLRAWSAGAVSKGERESEAKKIEDEMEKVVEVVKEEAVRVEKEVAKVEKEVVKAEKAVKKGARKTAKKAKAEVEKPKARPRKKKS